MADFDEETKEKLLVELENAGQLFPGYQLNRENGRLKLLGNGGFSSVYAMREVNAQAMAGEGRAYALKVIGMEWHTVSNERFRETCRLQRKLAEQSPYIMRLLDSRELQMAGDGTEVMQAAKDSGVALQLILLEQLDPILEKDRFRNVRLLREDLEGEEGVLQFALQIGEAIQTAHRNRVLHRDIKLENIFWNEAAKVYQLGDFGIAKFVERGQAETLVYTDGYGAPEIERRLADHYNATADIYSFGITLYLLLNDLKFPGSDRYSTISVQYDPDFVFPAPERASGQLAGIIRKMCSFYPEDRYQSMEEVLRELRLAAAGEKAAKDSPKDPEEFLEDRPTVTYHDDGSEEEQPGENRPGTSGVVIGRKTRMARLDQEKHSKFVYRVKEVRCIFCFSVLLMLILYGTEKRSGFVADWRFFLLPAAVFLEAVLLHMKDFYIAFGMVTFGFGIYSAAVIGGTDNGITVPHIVLLLCLLVAVPAVNIAGAVAVLLWMFLRIAIRIPILSPVLDFLTKDWIIWIYPVFLLAGMNEFLHLGEKAGAISPWRIRVWRMLYFGLPFLSILAGGVLWILQKNCLHLVWAGLGLLAAKVIYNWWRINIYPGREDVEAESKSV